MSIAVELASNLLQMIIWTWFMTSFFGGKCGGITQRLGAVAVTLVTFAEISVINHIALYDGILSGAMVITYVIYAQIFLKGSLNSHIFISIFAIAIIFTASSILIFIISYFAELTAGEIFEKLTVWRVIGICLCRLFEFLIFHVILKISSEYALTKREWILFITMPLATWIAVIFMTQATVKSPEVLPQMFYIAIIMVAINAVIYFFMLKIKQDTQTKLENELLRMQHDNIKSMETNMKALCESTYAVKHDLEKHLLAVKAMAEDARCDEICEYVEKIVGNQLNNVQKIVFSSNDVFNAVINTKLALCREKSIIPSINISDEAVKHIESSDIAVLFGNIFDNAIEAAEKTDEKIIILDVRPQGEYVSIYMENSFNERFSDVKLKTTKQNRSMHGIGMKNVKRVVEAHDGMIECFKNKEGMFCCDILLRKHQ